MRYIILPDVHSPGHNPYVLNAILNYINKNNKQINGIIFLGDFLDSQSLSSYDENKVIDLTLGEEYLIGSSILDDFDQALGDPKSSRIEKHFIYGNHENRFLKVMSKNSHARYLGAMITPEGGLKLEKRGYKIYKDWMEDYVQLGNFQIIHGLYTTVYPAKKHIEMYQSNLIFGHSHRINTHYAMGYYALNIGWLGDKKHKLFKYMPRAQRSLWKNAFATLDIIDGKGFPQIHIWDDDFKFLIIEGKKYKG